MNNAIRSQQRARESEFPQRFRWRNARKIANVHGPYNAPNEAGCSQVPAAKLLRIEFALNGERRTSISINPFASPSAR